MRYKIALMKLKYRKKLDNGQRIPEDKPNRRRPKAGPPLLVRTYRPFL